MKTFTALLITLCALVSCSKQQDTRPNIVLVTVDTLRWDYLSSYGYPDLQISPAVTDLAANGLQFESAITTAGTTVPAHASMMTGLYPRMHGARSNFFAIGEKTPTIAEALYNSGYQTAAFVSAKFLIDLAGLGKGFDSINTPFRDPVRGGLPQSGAKTLTQVFEWLDTKASHTPFFLWTHLWEPHGPYEPTEWSAKRLPQYNGFLADGVSHEHTQAHALEITESTEDLNALRTLYAGEVNLADHYLGQLMEALESRRFLDNTVVIFTADHGQSLGENGAYGHGPTHRENVIRVPLIIADFRNPAAQRSNTRVSVVDIAPTIAYLAGIEQSFDLVGRSLLPVKALADDWPYFVEVAYRTEQSARDKGRDLGSNYDPDALAVYVGPLKMEQSNGRVRLFQTGPDPDNSTRLNLKREAVTADYMEGLMQDFMAFEYDPAEMDISDENLKLLQGLGYVQ